jgi:hypothetical protein
MGWRLARGVADGVPAAFGHETMRADDGFLQELPMPLKRKQRSDQPELPASPEELECAAGEEFFDLEKAREIARGNVRDALKKGVPVMHVRLIKGADGSIRRVLERIHPDGRVEYLGKAGQ